MTIDKTDHRHWRNREWLLSTDVPDALIKAATKLEEKEKRLREHFFVEDLNEYICEVFANDLSASYAIEGEQLNSSIVKSSIIRQMNFDLPVWTPKYSSGQREAEATAMAISFLNMDDLTHEMIVSAHAKLSDIHFSGRYRQGDEEEIIRSGKEIVYYAPSPYLVRGLMDDFLGWWNDDRKNLPAIIGSAIGHSIFVIIHPFGDGNGRVSRALSDKAMITGNETIFRPYSLSTFILRNRDNYYKSLQSVKQTPFITFMLDVYDKALNDGFEKARLLQFSRYFSGRFDFSGNERRAIRKIILSQKPYWEFSDFEDISDQEEVWESLRSHNIITDTGEFDAEWRPKTKSAPMFRP